MNKIFSCLVLILLAGQLTSGQIPRTFEGMLIQAKKQLTELPEVKALNRKLASILGASQLMQLISNVEEMKALLSLRNISKNCVADVLYAIEHRGSWTTNMLDAMSKPPPSIQSGALNWIGGFEQCMSNPPPNPYNGSGSAPRSHYCRAKFAGPQKSLVNLFAKPNFGLCVPERCSARDVAVFIDVVLTELAEIFPNKSALLIKLDEEDAVYCWKNQSELELSGPAIGMIIVTAITGFFLLLGTGYDLLVIRGPRKATSYSVPINATATLSNGDTAHSIANAGEGQPGGDFNYEVLEEDQQKHVVHTEKPTPTLRAWEKALVAFSVYSNGLKILDAKQQPGRLNCLDGVRFLSMSWVILGHSYFFAVSVVNNFGYVFPLMMNRWTYQAIVNATFSVDSFFVLSGLLTAYMFMKEANKMGTINNAKFWILYFFHRFWRLTPPYMLFLGFYTALLKYMSNGPMWSQQTGLDEPNCQKYWWTNLLYINNIADSKDMCMGWTWYLANDMQFHYFVASVILPLVFFWMRYPQRKLFCFLAVAVSLAYLLLSLIYSGILSSSEHYGPGTLGAGDSFDKMYIKPWCRVCSYVVGLVTGCLIVEHQKRKWRLHPSIVVVGWMVATGTCLAVLYGLSGYIAQKYTMSTDVAALYNSLSRFAWSAGLSWLIYACLTGNGGWINRLLSWPAFIPLSRLTYCAYLVHPVVMVFFYNSLEFSPVVSTLTVVYWFFGHMVASYMLAFVLSVVWESPLIGLERIVLKKQ